MATCTVCGGKASFMMSMCDLCIEKQSSQAAVRAREERERATLAELALPRDAQSAHASPTVVKQREIVALAAGHRDLLRAYFGFQAYGGLLVGGLLLLSPIIGHTVTVPGRPWVVLPLAALNSWAAFRTRRLLGEGESEGVWMAAGMFACNLLAAIATRHPGIGAIFSGIGLVLAGSVWRGIRASAALIATPRPDEP